MIAMSKKIIAKSGGQLQPEKGGQFHPEKAGVLIRNIHIIPMNLDNFYANFEQCLIRQHKKNHLKMIT